MTQREFKRKFKPWITDGVLNSVNRKNKLHNKIHNEYKILRNQVNEIIQLNKKIYFENFFIENCKYLKKVWQGIKEIIDIKSKNDNIPNCLEVNDELITDIPRISDNFNDYFSNIAENILKSSKHKIGKTFDKYLSIPLNNYFVFEPCDPGEVLYLIWIP